MSYIDTKIIAITSQSATIKKNGSFLSELRYEFGQYLTDEPNIIHRQVQLLNAQIPVSFYVINYTNNQFKLKLGAGSFIIYTIPVGNYQATSLISAIKTVVNDVNFNITISSINGCLTFTDTTTITIDNTISNSIGFVLGFAYGIYNDTGFSLTAPHLLNLLGIKTLQVRSNNLSCSNISSVQGGMTTLLATIPVSATPFGFINYKDVGNNLISITNTSLDDLDIEIVDGESGAFINFNNQDWCITLAIHITRLIEPSVKPTIRDLVQGAMPLKADAEAFMPSVKSGSDEPLDPQQTKPIPSLQTSLQFLEQSKKPENKDLEELDLLTQ